MNDLQAALSTALADRYRIERGLGAGGMATVYLAHDIRHDRRVALKVLRPELSAILGAERFLTEIKTTANLQHPHILSLFDSGEAAGFVYYVMPYVDGESLRDRITREKQLPVDEALRLAREVADALEYAHQHGVVHRDIKPENILLHGGHAVVADFGIALAASRSEGGTRMTETGMSLGTPHYMSPEQAMGDREITPRADIYALGCVLYEMLTGEPPFVGASAQAIIGRVLTEEPRSLSAQRKTIPPNVDDAVRMALSKLPADRFASAKEFSEALTKPGFTAVGTTAAPRVAADARPARKKRDFALLAAPWVIVLATLGLYANGRRSAAPTPAPVTRFSLTLAPAPQVETSFPWHPMALSPDGSRLVYVGIPATGQQLFVRRFDALGATPVPGTAGAANPFFSADGSQIAFVSANRLMKVSVDGGAPIGITSVGNNFWGGTWSGDSILFADDRGLVLVPSGGGDPTVVLPRQGNTASWRWPEFLPDGKSVLLAINEEGVDRVAIFTMSDRTMQRTDIIGANPHYVIQGFVVVALFAPGGSPNAVGSGTLVAIPFDPRALKPLGSAIPVSENVQVGPVSRSAKAAISRTGTIAFAPGAVGLYTLVEVDRSGNAREVSAEPRYYSNPRLSPDGRRVAVTVQEPTVGLDIWVLNRVAGGGLTRLTFDKTASRAVWTPDGRRIAYQRTGNLQDLAWIAADGSSAAPETLLVADDDQVPGAFTPDGRAFVIREGGVSSPRRISMIPLDTPRTSQAIVSTAFDAHSPSLSPDGKWMAYASMETNSPQIYVRPFPGPGGKWQVSRDGGDQPRWSPAGGEIFFRSGDRIMSVPVTTTGAHFSHGEPRTLFSFRTTQAAPQYTNYDVTRDGKSFIMIQPPQSTEQASMIVLLNWFDNQTDRSR